MTSVELAKAFKEIINENMALKSDVEHLNRRVEVLERGVHKGVSGHLDNDPMVILRQAGYRI